MPRTGGPRYDRTTRGRRGELRPAGAGGRQAGAGGLLGAVVPAVPPDRADPEAGRRRARRPADRGQGELRRESGDLFAVPRDGAADVDAVPPRRADLVGGRRPPEGETAQGTRRRPPDRGLNGLGTAPWSP